jgi:hypothetical protein
MPQQAIIDGEGNVIGYAPSYNATPANTTVNTQSVQNTNDGARNPWDLPVTPNPNTVINNPVITDNTNTRTPDTNVQAQQNELITQGYELPLYGADGFMGAETQGALDRRTSDRTGAADTYGVDPNDITFNPNTNKFEPKLGAINAEGQTWNEGWVTTEPAEEEKWVRDRGKNAENNQLTEDEFFQKQEEEEELSLFQRLGINSNTAMSLVEGMAILKANRQANNANAKIGELNVSTDVATPQTYNPELVDLSKAQKDAKELGVAAVRHSQESGKSTAETRALMTGTTDAIEKIAKTESELQKQENNIAKRANMEERRNVEQYNITNKRKDQIANNDIKADMYNNSVAITQNMRDTILTKIKDTKMLGAVEAQIDALSGAIAGVSGLDDRKFDDIAKSLLSYGKSVGIDYTSQLNTLQKALKALEEENTAVEENKHADGGFWARRKMMRQNRK